MLDGKRKRKETTFKKFETKTAKELAKELTAASEAHTYKVVRVSHKHSQIAIVDAKKFAIGWYKG
jgi:Mor family transcriptional regulator